jgi:hypothetical protein
LFSAAVALAQSSPVAVLPFPVCRRLARRAVDPALPQPGQCRQVARFDRHLCRAGDTACRWHDIGVTAEADGQWRGDVVAVLHHDGVSPCSS